MFRIRLKEVLKFDRYAAIGIVFGAIGGISGALTARLFI